MEKQKEKELKLEIQLDDETASGQYTNMAVINQNDSEFVFDFIYVQPQAPKAKVQARLITSPRHAKRLLKVLQQNVDAYERQHGELELEATVKPQAVTERPVH